MAILKSIPIHNVDGISNCINYTTDNGKTAVLEKTDGTKVKVRFDNEGNAIDGLNEISSDIKKALAYAENVEKTAFKFDEDEDILVSGFNCRPASAADEFMNLRYNYEEKLRAVGIDPASLIKGKKNGTGKNEGKLVNKEAREAYHIIMSFSSRPDLTPQLVHRIGLEFCEKAFPDTKAVVSTHMNTDHLHNHIVRSAYNISSASKYKDNMENLRRLRTICNEISLKYGLDIIIDTGRENIKGNSYIEQLERERGSSWKEIIKEDIKKCIELAGSWDGFKQKMTERGYGIDEKPKSCTFYFLNDEKKRIRDNTLGDDFTRDFIKKIYGEYEVNDPAVSDKEKAILKEAETRIRIEASQLNMGSKPDNYKAARNRNDLRRGLNLYVPRYTPTGRRRSDIELMFTAAAKLVKHYGTPETKETQTVTQNVSYQNVEKKLKTMQESISLSVGLGIKNEEHLKELKKVCGSKKSVIESNLKSIEEGLKASAKMLDKIESIRGLQELVTARGLDNIDICVLEYSKEAVQANRAKLQPMNPKQRKELFTKLNDKNYRVTTKFENISYSDANRVLDFLKGKSDKKPDILVTEAEYEQYKKNKYYNKNADKDKDQSSDPDFSKNEQLNVRFEQQIKDLPEKDKDLIYRYRAYVNELASLGYSIDDIQLIIDENSRLAKSFNEMRSKIRELSLEYRNLCRIEHNYELAQDKAFTHGLTPSDKDKAQKEPELEEDKVKVQAEEEKQVKSEEVQDKDKPYSQEDVLSVDDVFF